MMKRTKKAAALLLAAAMLLALAACGGDTPGAQETETPDFVYVASYSPVGGDIQYVNQSCYFNGRIYFVGDYLDGQRTESYPVYDENGEPLLDENGEPVMEEYTYDNYATGLFSMADDGTDVKVLPGYTMQEPPAGYDGSSYISNMFAAGDSLYVMEQASYYGYMNSQGQMVDYMGNVLDEQPADSPAAPEAREAALSAAVAELAPTPLPATSSSDIIVNPDGEELTQLYMEQTILSRLDAEGNLLSSIDLNSLGEGKEYFYINGVTADGAGNIVCNDSDGVVYVLDQEGNKLFTVDATEINENAWVYNIMPLSDGRVGVLMNWYDEANQRSVNELRLLDMDSRSLSGEPEAIPEINGQILPGSGEYDFYMNGGTSLYGCRLGEETAENIVTWINCDVDSSGLSSVTPLGDGRIICLYTDYNSADTSVQLVTLKETPTSEVQQKTTLTYACMYLSYDVRRHILDFNRTNPTYRIEVRDYSEYNTSDDYNAGLTRLTTDIISGNAPDLISTDNLDFKRYAGKGLFEDLWPYIDADEELGGRGAVVEEFFNAMSDDGKLYAVYPGFYIITMEGPTAVFGEEMGVSFEQVREAMERYPEITTPLANYTRSDMLSMVCYYALDNYVDWESSTCSFDQGFADVLEFCNLFPTEYPEYDPSEPYRDPLVQLRDGQVLMNPAYISDFSGYSRVGNAVVEGGTTYIGLPGVGGSGGAFICDTGIAMSANCSDKEGAWQFMRRYVDGSFYDYNYNFSTNRAKFDAAMEEAMTPVYYTDENGQQVEASVYTYYIDDDNQVELYAMTQAEADKILDLISETTAVSVNADQQLMSIITEEAEAYFAGQRSAQDAAAMIQSRASIYVSEQS